MGEAWHPSHTTLCFTPVCVRVECVSWMIGKIITEIDTLATKILRMRIFLTTCRRCIQYPDVIVSGTPIVRRCAVVPQNQDFFLGLETSDSAYVAISTVLFAPLPVRAPDNSVAYTFLSCHSWSSCPCHYSRLGTEYVLAGRWKSSSLQTTLLFLQSQQCKLQLKRTYAN